jgi:RTA1 like protein
MVYVGSGYSIIRPSFVTPVFVGFDVLAIATQGIGSALIFGTDVDINKLSRGRTVLIIGLFIQLVAFCVRNFNPVPNAR